MIVLDFFKSNEIRQQYIRSFVNTHSCYYRDRIEKKTEFSDGLHYDGYLWDCLLNPEIITESKAAQILNAVKNIFIMWDIHSCDRILIPNYWKYPKTSVLVVNEWQAKMAKELPEDIYLFDDSFSWSVVYTHETDTKGNRYCIYLS